MPTKSVEITPELVREYFDYDPETGRLALRKHMPYQRVAVGTEPGHIDNNGYRRVKLFGKRVQAHILIWMHQYGARPVKLIDHINRIKTDNRLSNLRDVSASMNAANRTPNNKADFLGVYYYSKTDSWSARISVNHQEIYLGWWKTKEEAIAARQAAEKLLQFLGQD
jgi:hypothetical protein